MTRLNYDLSDFSDDGTLKVPFTLWVALAFLARHVLLLLMGGVSSFVMSRRGIDTGGFIEIYSSPLFLLASLPAVAVLVAALRRNPQAGRATRAIWRNGRLLSSTAAALDIGILLSRALFASLSVTGFVVAMTFLDVYVLVYLLRSVRVKDTFEDFPVSHQENTTSGN